MIWGAAFIAQRNATEHLGPFTFNALRLGLAAVVLCFIDHWFSTPRWKQSDIRPGLILGFLLFLALGCQQIGVAYTSAGKAGFITGLYVLLVPIELWIFWRRKLDHIIWFAAGLAVFGLFLLSGESGFRFSYGDSWVLACAVLFAAHVIWVEQAVLGTHPLKLAILQNAIAALLSSAAALSFEHIESTSIYQMWPELIYAGVLSSAFAYTVQIFSQRHTPAANVAIICSLESVFAAIAGWYFLNEAMNSRQIAGCSCILLGTLLPHLQLRARASDEAFGN